MCPCHVSLFFSLLRLPVMLEQINDSPNTLHFLAGPPWGGNSFTLVLIMVFLIQFHGFILGIFLKWIIFMLWVRVVYFWVLALYFFPLIDLLGTLYSQSFSCFTLLHFYYLISYVLHGIFCWSDFYHFLLLAVFTDRKVKVSTTVIFSTFLLPPSAPTFSRNDRFHCQALLSKHFA